MESIYSSNIDINYAIQIINITALMFVEQLGDISLQNISNSSTLLWTALQVVPQFQ